MTGPYRSTDLDVARQKDMRIETAFKEFLRALAKENIRVDRIQCDGRDMPTTPIDFYGPTGVVRIDAPYGTFDSRMCQLRYFKVDG